jgi:hypothetical protein
LNKFDSLLLFPGVFNYKNHTIMALVRQSTWPTLRGSPISDFLKKITTRGGNLDTVRIPSDLICPQIPVKKMY